MIHAPEKWQGYFAASPTMFKVNGDFDAHAQESIYRYYIQETMDGILLAGTVGEWTTLDKEERCYLFEHGRRSIPRDIPLLAGCSAYTVEESLYYARYAEKLGFDGALLTPPPHVVPRDEEVIHFYKSFTQGTLLPTIVYNWPLGTGIDLNLELLSELSTNTQLVGLKHSTSNREHFLEVLKALQAKWRIFGVMPGNLGLEILRYHGGHGCIGAMGVLGHHQPEFFRKVRQGLFDDALVHGLKDQTLMTELFDGFRGKFGSASATFKYLLELQGLASGSVRKPLLPLSDSSKKTIRELAGIHQWLL